jgi:DNA-binding transcriptional LysR family regulator
MLSLGLSGSAAFNPLVTSTIRLYHEVIVACRSNGFDPVVGHVAPQISSVLSLVLAGPGVSVVPGSITQI